MMTIDQIAAVANVKRRSVVDWIQKSWLKPAMKHKIPGKSGAAISLFDPMQVDELLRKRAAAKSELVPDGAPGPMVRSSPMAVATNLRPIDGIGKPTHPKLRLDVLAAAAAGREVWLTIPEASVHTGLPDAYLRRLIHEGKLKAIQSGAWYVRRRDLDKL